MRVFWTDGSANPNPGPGGFAVLEDGKPVALGGEPQTTNIRMEGLALLAAMKAAAGEPCEIHTDSEFWVNVLTKWATSWKRNGWVKRSGPIANLQLVQELYKGYTTYPVELVWVRGHAGTEMNELADMWANRARAGERV